MNEQLLLEFATDLGHRLAMCGAETFRIEESVSFVLKTYGYDAEVFSIPNNLTVSIITADGRPMTMMRRIGNHGSDLDAIIRYNALCRLICTTAPNPEKAMEWLREADASCRFYSLKYKILYYFLGAFGFGLFYNGDLLDALGSGVCGLMILLVDLNLEKLKAPGFFRTILAAFVSAMMAYVMYNFGLIHNADATIIGALMLLVPGLLFTNAMRDVMYGDTNSGLNRVVQVLLIAVAIALGTAAALNITIAIWGEPVGTGLMNYGPIMQNLACFVGCLGFAMYFNVHGGALVNGAIGGILAWCAYLVTVHYTGSAIWGNLAGGIAASLYAEVLARIWKKPAICYLVIGIFPLIPGAGVYYTMCHAVSGNTSAFANQGMETAAVAGAIALGILLVSTIFRLWSSHQINKRKK